MVSCGKTLILMLVALFLTLALLVPSMTNGQITSSYSNNTYINTTAFTLTIYSPDNQTYKSTMPLNFTIEWTEYPDFAPLPSPPAPIMNGVYSYTIDNNPAVTVTSNQSSSDVLDPRGFKVNPTFSYLVNVSNLANGYHKIVITASLSGLSGGSFSFTASSSPVLFLVQHPPNITIFSPQNKSYAVANVSSSSIPLNFTVDKPTSWIGYSLDNQNNMTVAGNSTLTGLTYGLHTLAIYANDTYGNTGSQTINFTVEKPQIEIFGSTMTVAIIVIPIAIVCIAVGLLVYRKKHKH
jgi:F0F1-type ATP synthase membrane subunit c/vacuolar-type H+-ATPase subunit K